MFKIIQEQSNGVLQLRLQGDLTDESELPPVEEGVSQIRVICKEIRRISSSGVRAWINHFQSLAERNIKITLAECSPVIVQQMSQIANFSCGATIESIFVPFACLKCKGTGQGLFRLADVAAIRRHLPTPDCPFCKDSKMVFDDIAGDYFGFLDPKPKRIKG